MRSFVSYPDRFKSHREEAFKRLGRAGMGSGRLFWHQNAWKVIFQGLATSRSCAWEHGPMPAKQTEMVKRLRSANDWSFSIGGEEVSCIFLLQPHLKEDKDLLNSSREASFEVVGTLDSRIGFCSNRCLFLSTLRDSSAKHLRRRSGEAKVSTACRP